MIHSFRLRLALLSATLTGVVLAAFGLGSWWLIRNVKMDRLDSDLRSAAHRLVTRNPTDTPWAQVEVRLTNDLGVRDPARVLLLVQGGDAVPVYRSAHWPNAIDAGTLDWAAPPPEFRAELPDFSFFPRAFAQETPDRPPHRGPRPDGMDPARRPPPPPPRMAMARRLVDGAEWHLALASTSVARVALGADARVIDAEMRGIRNAFLVALPFALVLIGLGSWLFAARALRPVHKLVTTTRKVTVEGLGQRIDATGEDKEFAELIEVYNRMLARLERSFQQAHRFTADAAHELKTPLAIVQGQLERAINQTEGRAIQTTLTSVLDEVRRLSVISRKLLLLSQADAGRLTIFREPVDLSKMLEELMEDTRMLAPHLTLHSNIHGGLQLQADSGLLRQVLHNLISNAIKYNVDGGWIRIATSRWEQRIEVVVSNASQGIPAQDRGKIFERFFRADPAHSRHVEGVGLGLSLSREIARAHGGDLLLKSDAGGAVEFSLLLPL
jgi:signal transduction histidine kinase